MSDDENPRNSFEEALRAIAAELNRSMERVANTDWDELVRSTGVDPDQARQWAETAGGWLRTRGPETGGTPPAPPRREDPWTGARPHPLDVPTTEQGEALAALDSGRWVIEPGTSALTARGDGPGPSDALGLVRELRVRDWLSADGEVTLAGRRALGRWLDAAG